MHEQEACPRKPPKAINPDVQSAGLLLVFAACSQSAVDGSRELGYKVGRVVCMLVFVAEPSSGMSAASSRRRRRSGRRGTPAKSRMAGHSAVVMRKIRAAADDLSESVVPAFVY